jgi:hypothetical protein
MSRWRESLVLSSNFICIPLALLLVSRGRESLVFSSFFSHTCETRAKRLRTRTRYAGGFVGGTVAAPRGAALGGGYGDPNGYASMQRAPSQQQQPQYMPAQGSSDRGRQGDAEETGFFDRHPGVGARARGGGGGGGGGGAGAGAGAGGHQGESYGDELRRQMAEQAARKQTAVKGRRKQEQDDEVSVCAHVRPRA